MAVISRNGKTYDNASVQIAFLGSIDYEVTKLEYNTKQAHKANYSMGSNKASSYSMGKISNDCKLGLRLKSVSEIEKAAKAAGLGGSLLKIKPFDIIVVFVDDENEIITDVIKCKFQEQGRTMDAEGDGEVSTKEFEMFTLDIDYNITG